MKIYDTGGGGIGCLIIAPISLPIPDSSLHARHEFNNAALNGSWSAISKVPVTGAATY